MFRYHGKDAAEEARQGFNATFADGGVPKDAPLFTCEEGETSSPVSFLTESKLAPSKSEAKRLVAQGSLSINDEKCNDALKSLPKGEYTIRLGKKRFLLLTVK